MPNTAQVLAFEFRGAARESEQSSDDKRSRTVSQIVDDLNRISDLIAEQIATDLRKRLPIGVQVETSLEFREGSLEWVGVIYVLDWMARLSGAGALVEYIVRVIRLVVNRAVRQNISQPSILLPSADTEVTVLHGPSVAQPALAEDRSLRPVTWLALINTVLLIALILIVVLRHAP